MLADKAQNTQAGLRALLREFASVLGALDSERGALTTMLGDMAADKRMLSAQGDVFKSESADLMAKLQQLWDEKEGLDNKLADTSAQLEAVSGRHVAFLFFFSAGTLRSLCAPACLHLTPRHLPP